MHPVLYQQQEVLNECKDFEDPPHSSMIQKYFQKEMWSLMKQVYCGHKVISNDDMDFDDSKVLMIPKCTNDKR